MNVKFEDIPEEIQTLKKELKQLKELIISDQSREITKSEDGLVTIDEAVKIMSVSKATLWRWCNQGKLNKYSIGGKRYFKKEELLNSLKSVRDEK